MLRLVLLTPRNLPAEFCETQHRFSVRVGMDVDGETFASNDQALYQYSLKDAGTDLGCAAQVQDGVTPNQYGTWSFGRAGWCPGSAVSPWIVDVTGGMRPGMKAVIGYVGLFNESAYTPKPCHGSGCAANGFAPEIKMVSRLVLYEHPYDKDLDGSQASEPESWKPPAAEGKTVQLPIDHPIDDGKMHWGWMGGVQSNVDKGLWPQNKAPAPIELLQADGASRPHVRRAGGGGDRERRLSVTGNVLGEMGSLAGVGAVVLAAGLVAMRQRRREALGQQYTAV